MAMVTKMKEKSMIVVPWLPAQFNQLSFAEEYAIEQVKRTNNAHFIYEIKLLRVIDIGGPVVKDSNWKVI